MEPAQRFEFIVGQSCGLLDAIPKTLTAGRTHDEPHRISSRVSCFRSTTTACAMVEMELVASKLQYGISMSTEFCLLIA
jgi:hypothetical protein